MDDLLKYGEVQRGTIPRNSIDGADDPDCRSARRAEHARRFLVSDLAALRRLWRPACAPATSSSASTTTDRRRLAVPASAGGLEDRHHVEAGVLRESRPALVEVPIVAVHRRVRRRSRPLIAYASLIEPFARPGHGGAPDGLDRHSCFHAHVDADPGRPPDFPYGRHDLRSAVRSTSDRSSSVEE